jgi:hypothetical protein
VLAAPGSSSQRLQKQRLDTRPGLRCQPFSAAEIRQPRDPGGPSAPRSSRLSARITAFAQLQGSRLSALPSASETRKFREQVSGRPGAET